MIETDKPFVLWTCDVPGWAYHNRFKIMRRAMPHFDHQVFYFGSRLPLELKEQAVNQADILVCQGVKAMRIVQHKALNVESCSLEEAERKAYANMVVRIDSMRVDIDGAYVDIFARDEGQDSVVGRQ